MKRIIAIILALLLMIPTGITAMAVGGTITSVNLPVSETDLWSGAEITTPTFYSSLECVVGGKVTTVDGFTWKCDNYSYDTVGSYVFTAVAPSGYTFGCDTPTITVNVKSGGIYHCASYFMARDYVGQHISFRKASDTLGKFYDRTGFNNLVPTSEGTGHALNLIAGVGYKKTMTEPATANVWLDNAGINYYFAGSFGTNFKGTSTVYVNGGTIDTGLYAGSVNGTFEGTTNIYLSGAPVIKTLSCGGHYEVNAKTSGNGSTVGSNVVSYDGTVNIYLADDFTGKITNIDTADAEQINFYISPGAKFDLSRYQISKENVNVYIDGVNYDVISDVQYKGADFVVTDLGTAETDVIKDSITVYAKEKATVLSDIKWESADYSATKTGVYKFKPVLPEKYVLADGVELPTVDVLVANSGEVTVESISYVNETVIPEGISLNELDMPDTVSASFTLNNDTHTYDIPATFTTQNYLPTAGVYTFELSVDQVFNVTTSPSMKVTVSTDAKVNRSGDVYEINSAAVRFSGEERKNYKITDIAGIYTYFDNVDLINAVYVKGSGVEVAVDSDVVRVENKIDLNETSGKVTLDIPVALVTRVRYASSISEYVYINGVRMDMYDSITASVNTSKKYLYANGVPSVIAKGADDGTYLYRANDMSLMYSGDITGWTRVYGGGSSGTSLASTNIAFMSGYLNNLYAGGEGTVKDATVVLDGGCVAYLRGAGISGSNTLHTTVILESGQHKEYIMGGGASGSTTGDSSKNYADDEYSIEMHVYGGAYTNIYLGASGTVYGNINLIQHGGKLMYIITSGAGTVHGNIDATVYGGVWEYTYETQNITGKSTLRLYKGLLRHNQRVYPFIEGDNVTITYFGGEENFEFVRYTQNRDSVISSDGDAGKLVIRFLETRYPGEDKYKYRYYDSIGDCMYITFPNGQNMLVDAGEENTAPLVIETLKELGVTKLDYVLITHSHSDHYGGLPKVVAQFPIDTFIIQDQISVLSAINNAVEKYGSTILRANRYDSMTIGDVEIYALNPAVPMQDHLNTASMATLLTYGDAKILLAADTYLESETDWLDDEIIAPKIKDCDLIKLGHHGYPTSSGYEFINHVNPDKVAITSPREYGGYIDATIFQLTDGNGIDRNDIYVTGKNGLLKFAFDGTDSGMTVDTEYTKILPYYADYSEVESMLTEYDTYTDVLSQEDIEKWEEACSLVEYNLPYEDQDIVDGMAEHLGQIYNRIAKERTITATNLTGYVTNTVFPYNDNANSSYWSEYVTHIESPIFYDAIPVTIDGKEIKLPVTWECTSTYDGKAVGTTFTFRAVAEGYVWNCEVPEIKVKVVDAGLTVIPYRVFGFSSTGDIIPTVVKNGDGLKTILYDATGCNVIYSALNSKDKDYLDFNFFAGISNSEGTGKKPATGAVGDTKMLLDGSGNLTRVFGGSFGIAHKGNTYIYANNTTFVEKNEKVAGIYGGGFSSDLDGNTYIYVTGTSEIPNIFGGANSGNVTGDSHIDISGKAIIDNVYGGSNGNGKSLGGTAYVSVYDLEEGSVINRIARGSASNLVVNLDASSASLLSVVENVNTDRNTQVYIDGVLYVPSADYSVVETAISSIPDDLSVYTDESVAALNNAKNAVDYNLTGYDQEKINGYATAIEEAVANLKIKYVVEVQLGEDSDYIAGKKLVLVFTNFENQTFKYDGVQMYDVSSAGYKYNDEISYSYVYAIITEAIYLGEGENAQPGDLEDYEERITLSDDGYAIVINYNNYDVTGNNKVDWNDVTAAYNVVTGDVYSYAREMAGCIKADINHDKHATAYDINLIIKAR